MINLKLANVFYDEELVSINKNNYLLINFINVADDYSNVISNGLPSLFVGYENLKRINKSKKLFKNISILEKQIIKNMCYWEFSYSENKQEHVNGVNYFLYSSPYFYFSRFLYQYLDPIFENIITQEQLFEKYFVTPIKAYELNDMIYIKSRKNIFGISKSQYIFYGFNIENIIFQLKNISLKYTEDKNNQLYLEYSKLVPNFDILNRYIVTIH